MLTASARAGARRYATRRAFGDVVPDGDGILRLRKGDKAPEVEDWQTNLMRLGFDLAVTGNFDDATLKATVAFQGAHGLKQTGIVEDATRQAMADDLDKMELPGSTKVPPPVTVFDPIQVTGRFPSWLWLLLPVGLFAWKRKKK